MEQDWTEDMVVSHPKTALATIQGQEKIITKLMKNQIPEGCAIVDQKELHDLVDKKNQLEDYILRLKYDLNVLIDESYGVSGLHLNGAVAPWSDLLTGGRYEEWLMILDEPYYVGGGNV
jgi:hypothetical protein